MATKLTRHRRHAVRTTGEIKRRIIDVGRRAPRKLGSPRFRLRGVFTRRLSETAGSQALAVGTHGLPSGAYLTVTGHFPFVRQSVPCRSEGTSRKVRSFQPTWPVENIAEHRAASNFRDFTSSEQFTFRPWTRRISRRISRCLSWISLAFGIICCEIFFILRPENTNCSILL